MHDNISYIEDEVEIARRSMMPPPPVDFLAPPAFLETAPQDKDERQRQQKLLDEARKFAVVESRPFQSDDGRQWLLAAIFV